MSTESSQSTALGSIPLSAPFVATWLNGLYTSLFLIAIWSTLRDIDLHQRSTIRIWLTLLIVCFVSSTIQSSICWSFEVHTIMTHSSSEPLLGLLESAAPTWDRAVGNTLLVSNMLLAEGFFTWRCWVVWGRRRRVILLPAFLLFVSTVLAGFAIAGQVASTISPIAAKFHVVYLPFWAISLGTSIIITLLISSRIIFIQRQLADVLDFTGIRYPYSEALETIVESGAIHTISLLVTFIFIVCNASSAYPGAVHSQASGLAPTLLLLRITLGYSRPNEDWYTTRHRSEVVFAANPDPPEKRKRRRSHVRLDALGNPLHDEFDDDVSDSGYDIVGGVSGSRSRRHRSYSGRLSVPSGCHGGSGGLTASIGGGVGGGAGLRSSIVTVESLVSSNGNRHQIEETDIGLWKSDSMSVHDSDS